MTHLWCADDTLILCDAEEGQLKILRVIFVLFEGFSGLHINRRKSYMYPINEVQNIVYLNTILGGEIGVFPTTYLGMPLGDRSVLWDLEQGGRKMWDEASEVESHYLSRGGRMTSINFGLDAPPTYMMSVFPIPRTIIDRLDKIRRKFLWQGNNEEKEL